MKISIKKLPKSQVELKIEVPAEEFDKFIEETIFDFGKNLEIQGFRKGKAPKEVIEKEVGQEKILAKATQEAVKENYIKAILDNKIEAISQPEIKILKLAPGNPLEFQAKITVLPEIDLPDYKKIASETKRRKIEVSEKEVEDSLLWLQKSRSKFVLKDKPAEKNDFVEIEFSSPQIENNLKREDRFILGRGKFAEGFEENLVKMVAGEEKEFSLVFPENYSRKNLAGKKVNFKVKMKAVQSMILPELDDEFAKSLGNFESFSALKESIGNGLRREKENQESQRVRQEILEKIARNSKLEIPDILIETEKRRMIEDLKKLASEKLKITFSDYLGRIKKTEEELLETLSPEAERKIKNFLVLREISKREKIEATNEEVNSLINEVLKNYSTVEKAKKDLDLEKLRGYYKDVIRNEKTLAKLESFVSGS